MRLRTFTSAAFLFAAGLAQGKPPDLNVVSKVEVQDAGNTLVISIHGSKPPNFTTFSMLDPPRFVVDLSESKFRDVPEEMPVSGGLIKSVRSVNYGTDANSIARLMIAFERDIEPPEVLTSGNTLQVKILKPGGMAVASAAPAEDAQRKAREEAAAKAEAETRAKAEAEAQAKADAKAKAQAEARAKAEAAAQAKAEEKARAEAETKAKAEAKAQAKVDAKAKAEEAARAKAEEKARAKAEAQAKAEEAAKAKVEEKARAEAEAKAKVEAKAQAKADAKAKAEEAARAKAEEKARAKAEAQAKAEEAAQAKAEAKAKTEEEARAKAEEKARVKAEAQAKVEEAAKAKAEAKAQAAVDAKAKAEAKAQAKAEAKAKAEEEARAKAEARAQARAEAKAKAEGAARAKAEQKATEPAASETAVVDLESGNESEAEGADQAYSAGFSRVREVGFQLLADVSRVFVRTSGMPRFSIQDAGENLVRVELSNTRVRRRNDTRFLDTSYFPSAVAMVTPMRQGSSYVLEIKLKQRVTYQQKVEGDTLSIDFERPASMRSTVPAASEAGQPGAPPAGSVAPGQSAGEGEVDLEGETPSNTGTTGN